MSEMITAIGASADGVVIFDEEPMCRHNGMSASSSAENIGLSLLNEACVATCRTSKSGAFFLKAASVACPPVNAMLPALERTLDAFVGARRSADRLAADPVQMRAISRQMKPTLSLGRERLGADPASLARLR